ncbi:MAG TPA: hypothetical protein VKV27_12195 [Solirubrobacteraceae bacterium]|nr:hypothetical protein [Solirubrobacteraceae bacterium]
MSPIAVAVMVLAAVAVAGVSAAVAQSAQSTDVGSAGSSAAGSGSPSSAPSADQLVATVLPRGGFSIAGVAGTSCVSATFCFAVGTGTVLHGRTRLTSNTALIWRYDGRSWQLSSRVRVGQSSLASISCVSGSFCLAVGRAGNPVSRVLALRWNGRSWSQVTAASPPSSGNGDALGSVDCLSRADCWAVGGTNLGEADARELVERWDGHRLREVAAPRSGNALVAVACARANDCWATTYPSAAQRSTNEVEHFDGRRWVRARLPISMSGGEAGISCRTLTTCWIVGDRVAGGLRPVAVHILNGSWKSTAMPSPQYPDVTLQGIGCASASYCWTVGGNTLVGPGISRPSEEAPFAEQWNGSAWQIASITGPPAARNGFLDTVSCAAAAFCIAGGQAADGGPLLAIAEHAS